MVNDNAGAENHFWLFGVNVNTDGGDFLGCNRIDVNAGGKEDSLWMTL